MMDDTRTARPGSTPAPPAVGVEEAAALIERWRREVPARPTRRQARRGIDVYREADLPVVVANAATIFRARFGRLPDPAGVPTTADGFFAVKFFDPIPVRPCPGDKLAVRHFLSPAEAKEVGIARTLWSSTRPELPDDDALPPGRYFLKHNLGNAMHRPVDWPPDAEARAGLEEVARRWLGIRYGLPWGEWWYATGRPRVFLEMDMTPLTQGRPEYKVMLRDGRVVFFYGIVRYGQGGRLFSFHDREGRRIEGRWANSEPLDEPLPDTWPLMLRTAETIGRRFRTVRVDFLNARGSRPCLGEITLCHQNARKVIEPPEVDAQMAGALFR